MTRNQIISELLGDNQSDYIAYFLKQSYDDLAHHEHLVTTNQHYVPIWDHDRDLELEELTKLQEAFELVYSWYSTNNIKD